MMNVKAWTVYILSRIEFHWIPNLVDQTRAQTTHFMVVGYPELDWFWTNQVKVVFPSPATRIEAPVTDPF